MCQFDDIVGVRQFCTDRWPNSFWNFKKKKLRRHSQCTRLHALRTPSKSRCLRPGVVTRNSNVKHTTRGPCLFDNCAVVWLSTPRSPFQPSQKPKTSVNYIKADEINAILLCVRKTTCIVLFLPFFFYASIYVREFRTRKTPSQPEGSSGLDERAAAGPPGRRRVRNGGGRWGQRGRDRRRETHTTTFAEEGVIAFAF